MHHKIICDRLSKLPFESRRRIMIFVPPQFGKSEIVSRHFPVWMLGHNPRLKVILASYSSYLADTFNRAAQKILLDESFKKIFQARLSAKHRQRVKQTQNYFELEWGGYLYSVGVGGSTTGRGCDLLIIDDPIKDYTDAASPTMRQRRLDWFQSVAQTRLSKDGHIIVMHTRWHESDLAGMILQEQKNDPEATPWEVISLPALGRPEAEYRHPEDTRAYDEPLWPEKKGDLETMQRVKKEVGEKIWASLYQQEPTIEGGNIIKASWLRYWQKLPFDPSSIPSHKIVQSWDLTFKSTSSYVVGLVLVLHDSDYYLIDFYREKVDIVKTLEAVRGLTRKYPNSSCLIEDKANGPAVLGLLKKEISRLIPVRPTASKDEGLYAVAPLFEAGRVYLPMHAPYTKLIAHELESFPASENDDICDAFSQGLTHFDKLTGSRRLEAMSKL